MFSSEIILVSESLAMFSKILKYLTITPKRRKKSVFPKILAGMYVWKRKLCMSFFLPCFVADALLCKWHLETLKCMHGYMSKVACQPFGASQRFARFLIVVVTWEKGWPAVLEAEGTEVRKESTAWFCHTLPYMSLYASAIMSRCELQRCVRMSISTSFSQPADKPGADYQLTNCYLFRLLIFLFYSRILTQFLEKNRPAN